MANTSLQNVLDISHMYIYIYIYYIYILYIYIYTHMFDQRLRSIIQKLQMIRGGMETMITSLAHMD